MGDGMELFTARLSSYDIVLQPAKRASSNKATKPISWPHKNLVPAELAQAGLYYEPHESNPDNTNCFLCHVSIDGWEEDDNPLVEHLKHSPRCGWAIVISIQQHASDATQIEDPTSERIADARRATFGSSWPHDGKRGWLCQSEKMVTSGWYFCPTEESEDLASCAYCKLSLDGWEPKDDPYEEHYRRSANCPFFAFGPPPGKRTKRTSRSRKPRGSKASRLSTQSTITLASEAPTVESDDLMDQSILSQSTTRPAKSTKKASKSKGRSGRPKKTAELAEKNGPVDVESNDGKQPDPSKPKRGPRGRKRQSHEMNDDPHGQEADYHAVFKKRITNSRNSIAQPSSIIAPGETNEGAPETTVPDEPASTVRPKMSGHPRKKGLAKSQMAPEISTASKASLRSNIPNRSNLNEDDPRGDAKADEKTQHDQPSELATETLLSGQASTTASTAPMRAPQQTTEADVTEPSRESTSNNGPHPDPEDVEVPALKSQPPKTSSKRKAANKRQPPPEISSQDRPSLISSHPPEDHAVDLEHHGSLASVEITVVNPAPAADAVIGQETASKMAGKRKNATNKRGRKADKTSKPEPDPLASESDPKLAPDEDVEPQGRSDGLERVETGLPSGDQDPEDKTPRGLVSREDPIRASKVPPKTTERYSDIPPDQHRTQSFLGSLAHDCRDDPDPGERSPVRVQTVADPKNTPSPSAQSSDAENRPPSSRPSAPRPPAAVSPTGHQTVRIPLAASPPPASASPSKRAAHPGFAMTPSIWTPVDADEFFLPTAGDAENRDPVFDPIPGDLTSPEKKMTVEEWIQWAAEHGEAKLKRECERAVSWFEGEGGRAMRVLEGVECVD
jgi:hypothetical protein